MCPFMIFRVEPVDYEIDVALALADHEYRLWGTGGRIQFILYPWNLDHRSPVQSIS